MPLVGRKSQNGVKMLFPRCEPPGQPSLLDQREARRHHMLQFIRRQSIAIGLLGELRGLCRPHPHFCPGKHLQRRQAHQQRQPAAGEHAARNGRRIFQPPLLEPQQRLTA